MFRLVISFPSSISIRLAGIAIRDWQCLSALYKLRVPLLSPFQDSFYESRRYVYQFPFDYQRPATPTRNSANRCRSILFPKVGPRSNLELRSGTAPYVRGHQSLVPPPTTSLYP